MILVKIAYLHAVEKMLVYTTGLGSSKYGVALRILDMAPTVGKKGVALQVSKKGASHLPHLHVPACQ